MPAVPREALPPSPRALRHLRPSDARALLAFGIGAAATTAGIGLSLAGHVGPWLGGQVLLAAALVQWFVILHECGHGTLFRHRTANVVAGQIAGAAAAIPFDMWTHVHRQHHRWTGWQDLDPTTSALAAGPGSRTQAAIVTFCWRYWIPLFSVIYRVSNFWHPSRLLAIGDRRARLRAVAGTMAVATIYAAIAWRLGWSGVLQVFGLAVLLAFIVEDMLILSQHTHVPMELSLGRRVPPHAAMQQERYTRSLRLPAIVSSWLLHFDAHELHHMYPFVPGYRLHEIPYETANEVSWWRWVRAARAVPGDVLLFQNRHQTGIDL